jgi:TrmH family RNA methyltransferase
MAKPTMRLVISRHNDVFKFLRALTEPQTRKKHRAFLLDGATFVAEALDDAPTLVRLVALTPSFAETERGRHIIAKAQSQGVPIVLMAPELLDELAPSETPQGVVAAIAQPTWERLERMTIPPFATFVILEGLQDPTNVGAILRTAAAVGAVAVLYTKGTADPFAPKTVRASAGSILRLPVLPISSVSEVQSWLKEQGVQLVATVPHGGTDCFDADYAPRVALVIGNEARGVSTETLQLADLKVSIPMESKVASLNAAVAAAVILYELFRRQRAMTNEAMSNDQLGNGQCLMGD